MVRARRRGSARVVHGGVCLPAGRRDLCSIAACWPLTGQISGAVLAKVLWPSASNGTCLVVPVMAERRGSGFVEIQLSCMSFFRLIRPAIRLIDTRRDSPNSRYLKSFVRGFRFGITAARSSCSKLRMLSATMNRVAASIWDKRMAFVSGRLTAAMVGRGPQTATRYSTALSRSRLLDHGRLRWTQVDCVGPLSPLLTAKAREISMEFLERP